MQSPVLKSDKLGHSGEAIGSAKWMESTCGPFARKDEKAICSLCGSATVDGGYGKFPARDGEEPIAPYRQSLEIE